MNIEEGSEESVLRRQAEEAFQSFRSMVRVLRADVRANARDPKAQLVLAGFRFCQFLIADPDRPRRVSIPFVLAYRLATEFILGMELRPKTRVGAGLTIYHGFGLVVNDHAIIGRGVVLRNGVVIGQAKAGGPSPRLFDQVEVGTTALILGDIEIGQGAVIGAGAVVVKDVPPRQTVVGNPARPVRGS
jgi:serine acetyltransferase